MFFFIKKHNVYLLLVSFLFVSFFVFGSLKFSYVILEKELLPILYAISINIFFQIIFYKYQDKIDELF